MSETQVVDLPNPVLRSGERTVFAFPSPISFGGQFLPYKLVDIEPCGGLVIEKIAIGKLPKLPTYEFGAPEIAYKEYASRRVLPDERLWIHVRNGTDDDMFVAGTLTLVSAPIPGMPAPEPRTFESDEEASREFADHLRTVVRRGSTLPAKNRQ